MERNLKRKGVTNVRKTKLMRILCLVFAMALTMGTFSTVAFADDEDPCDVCGSEDCMCCPDCNAYPCDCDDDSDLCPDCGNPLDECDCIVDDEVTYPGGTTSPGGPVVMDLDAMKDYIDEVLIPGYNDLKEDFLTAKEAFDVAKDAYDDAFEAYLDAKDVYDESKAAYEGMLTAYKAGDAAVSHADLVKARADALALLEDAKAALKAVNDAWDDVIDAYEAAVLILRDTGAQIQAIQDALATYNQEKAAAENAAYAGEWIAYFNEMKAYTADLSEFLKDEAKKLATYKIAKKAYDKAYSEWEAAMDYYNTVTVVEWEKQMAAYEAYLKALNKYESDLAAYNKGKYNNQFTRPATTLPDNAFEGKTSVRLYTGTHQNNAGQFQIQDSNKNKVTAALPYGVSCTEFKYEKISFAATADAQPGYIDIEFFGQNNGYMVVRVLIIPGETVSFIPSEYETNGQKHQDISLKAYSAPKELVEVEDPGEINPPEFDETEPVYNPGTFTGKCPDMPGCKPEFEVKTFEADKFKLGLGEKEELPGLDDPSKLPDEPGGGTTTTTTTTTTHNNNRGGNPPAPTPVAIDDVNTPLADSPIVIPEEEPPLADLPQTGIATNTFSLAMFGLSLLSLMAMPFIKRRVED